MAAWEESAAEWSSTNFGALDSSSTASAAEKENLGRCWGHLLLVHIAHDPAGREQGRDLHQRLLIIKGVGKGGQRAIPTMGTTWSFSRLMLGTWPLSETVAMVAPLLQCHWWFWSSRNPQRWNPALRSSWYKSDTWDFKPTCCLLPGSNLVRSPGCPPKIWSGRLRIAHLGWLHLTLNFETPFKEDINSCFLLLDCLAFIW